MERRRYHPALEDADSPDRILPAMALFGNGWEGFYPVVCRGQTRGRLFTGSHVRDSTSGEDTAQYDVVRSPPTRVAARTGLANLGSGK